MWATIKKVVFFGAHTDDEMICAGTLHRMAKNGVEVHVETFTCAATINDRKGYEDDTYKVLHPEWLKSMRLIGVKHNLLYDWRPSAELGGIGQRIADHTFGYIEMHKPDLAIILSPHDENTAHAVVGVECERVMRGRVPHVWRCLFPWNYSGDTPNLYVTLDEEDLAVKAQVIDAYESQKFRYNYRDMLLNYAIADGLSVKKSAAEKFQIVRSVL